MYPATKRRRRPHPQQLHTATRHIISTAVGQSQLPNFVVAKHIRAAELTIFDLLLCGQPSNIFKPQQLIQVFPCLLSFDLFFSTLGLKLHAAKRCLQIVSGQAATAKTQNTFNCTYEVN